MDVDFLEKHSLFQKFRFIGPLADDCTYWQTVSINMHCPRCAKDQTFAMANEYFLHNNIRRTDLRDEVVDLTYKCQSCHVFERRFLIYVSKDLQTVYKVGQYPAWEIKIDDALKRTLGKHADDYKKGLTCESQGYGIGAFAYYRRITENIIDELLDSISDLIEEEHKAAYGAALAKTKSSRVAQEKIELVKDLLPTILKPDGVNPLGVLHSELSEGLHAATDESCLENAKNVKNILVFMLELIMRSKESARSFTSSIRALLNKKSGK